MPILYTDTEITNLILESKLLPHDWRRTLIPTGAGAQRRADLAIIGGNGSHFRIMVRQSSINPMNFSVILGVFPAGSNVVFLLRRYNGLHGEHTNRIEGSLVTGFHVHYATERYQERGLSEEGYAERSDAYGNVSSALDRLISDCGFHEVTQPLGGLFEGDVL